MLVASIFMILYYTDASQHRVQNGRRGGGGQKGQKVRRGSVGDEWEVGRLRKERERMETERVSGNIFFS